MVNRSVPALQPAPLAPEFSLQPTEMEIRSARVFAEPLVPVGGEPTPAENAALASTITTALGTTNITQRLAAFEAFVQQWPRSPWLASLFANLGVLYRRNGYFERCESAERRALQLTKDVPGPQAAVVADAALGELLTLYAGFGRLEPLEEMLQAAEGRAQWGSPAERLREGRAVAWVLRNHHERAIPSATSALAEIRRFFDKDVAPSKVLEAFHADADGATLTEAVTLASQVGLPLRMAKRRGQAAIPLPALMHFKVGHYSAVLKQVGDHYLVQDWSLGGEVWMSEEALQEESSGYFLIPGASLPAGWEAVSAKVAAGIRGKCGVTANPIGEATSCNNVQQGGNGSSACGGGKCVTALATYSLHSLLVSVHIEDTPVGYSPPRGPSVNAYVTYNQRESFKPLTYTFTNLGSRWNLTWVAWIEDDPTNPNASVYAHLRGGGRQTGTAFNGTSFAPHIDNQAVITRTGTSPIRYERLLSDGSKEVYAQPDGAAASPRRVFLTQVVDPQGNAISMTYDSQLRLVAVTDAIGQVTTLAYDLAADPLKVTRIIDPFGRAAVFAYSATNQLASITDVIGLRSEFEYGNFDFITTLRTPYGATLFKSAPGPTPATDAGVEATDPLGGRERIQWLLGAPVADSDPAASVPTGFSSRNVGLASWTTFYWDKRAMMLAPGDYTKAVATRWNLSSTGIWDSISTVKQSLEGRIWFAYQQEPASGHSVGPLNRPTKIARVLDDGTSQIHRIEYNALGQITRSIDPVGRETVLEYDSNGIDRLRAKQRNLTSTGGFDLLQSTTYNSSHAALTITNAAGQTTAYSYDTHGHILTMVTPLRSCSGCAGENRATTWTYDANGLLQSVTRPSEGATTSFTYDGFGRPRTIADSQGYVVTIEYDALDRPTRITYPDGTDEQTAYSRLDVEGRRDRLGRWSRSFHDALRRPVSMSDAANHASSNTWCSCGSLDKTIDANGSATSWERDIQGRITTEIRSGSTFETYAYEATTSRLKTRTDAKGQVSTYVYAPDDALLQTAYSNASNTTPTVSLTYDATYRRAMTMTDGAGTTNFTYYPITTPPTLGGGLLQSVDGPLLNDTVSYVYDELNRVTTSGIGPWSTTAAYDSLGRRSSIESPIGTFGWTFVASTSRPQTTTYPNGQTTSYSYFSNNQDQRLQRITHQLVSGGMVLSQFDYTYDVVGNIRTWQKTLGAAPSTVYSLEYDAVDQLTAAVQRDATSQQILNAYGYSYDAAGNRTVSSRDSSIVSSRFNGRNQLVQASVGGRLRVTGTVGEQASVTVGQVPANVSSSGAFQGSAPLEVGNQTFSVAATDASGNARTNTYQTNVSGSGGTFTYDTAGNLCARGGDTCASGSTTYDWDAENRLVGARQGSTVLATFSYDGFGRRIQKAAGGITTAYVYDGQNIVEERRSNGQVYRYVQGGGLDRVLARQDQSGGVNFYLADHLGSVVQMTSSSGEVVLTRVYDPWGNQTEGGDSNGYAFTGREWDAEASTYYYRSRYYDAGMGRFLSEDPLGVRSGLNRYRYVDNNPLSFRDPLGLAKWTPKVSFRECFTAEQRQYCEAECAARGGVKTCTMMIVRKLKSQISPTDPSIIIQIWVDEAIWPPQCICNRIDEPICESRAKCLALLPLAILGVLLMRCLGGGGGMLGSPAMAPPMISMTPNST